MCNLDIEELKYELEKEKKVMNRTRSKHTEAFISNRLGYDTSVENKRRIGRLKRKTMKCEEKVRSLEKKINKLLNI